MADKIKGGEADGVPDSRYPKKKLEEGIKVELEHTDSRETAKEITKDHFVEEEKKTGRSPNDVKYYEDLKKMETSWEKVAFFKGFEKSAKWNVLSVVPLEDEETQRKHKLRESRSSAAISGTTLGLGGALAGSTIGGGWKRKALNAGIGGVLGGVTGATIGGIAGGNRAMRDISQGAAFRVHRDQASADRYLKHYGKDPKKHSKKFDIAKG